jgi:hypothetical protein
MSKNNDGNGSIYCDMNANHNINVVEYVEFLNSMDEVTIECYYAIEQERIQVETLE